MKNLILKVQLNSEMSKPDKNQDKLSKLDSGIKSLYGNIMANENMSAFNKAKMRWIHYFHK